MAAFFLITGKREKNKREGGGGGGGEERKGKKSIRFCFMHTFLNHKENGSSLSLSTYNFDLCNIFSLRRELKRMPLPTD